MPLSRGNISPHVGAEHADDACWMGANWGYGEGSSDGACLAAKAEFSYAAPRVVVPDHHLEALTRRLRATLTKQEPRST